MILHEDIRMDNGFLGPVEDLYNFLEQIRLEVLAPKLPEELLEIISSKISPEGTVHLDDIRIIKNYFDRIAKKHRERPRFMDIIR